MRGNVIVGVAIALGFFACGQPDAQLDWSNNGGHKDGGASGDDGGDTSDDGGTTTGDDGGTTQPGKDGGTQPGSDSGGPTTSGAPLAKGLTISEVAMFQGVRISIAKSGAKVTTRAAATVANREGLLRVYVAPQSGYTPKAITAELSLVVNGTPQPLLTDTKTISAASTDATLASTFNFSIPGGSLPMGTSYSVALTDPSLSGGRSTGADPARYPQDGSAESLDLHSTGAQLKVTLVPFQYNADGSGRLPDTSAAQQEIYRKSIYALYPAASVAISVRAPYAYSGAISASGSGFSQALQSLVSLRQQDGVAADVYYMGIFAPSASFNSYCGGGCVTGLSGVGTSPNDATVRASVGIGFTGTESGLTAAHEIGHAHGRQHAPCGGASGPDPAFPYSGGGIGVWGYNITTKALIDPAQGKDLMGYCQPEWISDYNYEKLRIRMATVNMQPVNRTTMLPEPQNYRFLSVEADGTASWGQETILRTQPFGTEHTVTYKAANGATLGTVTGYFYEYGDLPGGFMLVPAPPSGTVSTVIAGTMVGTTVKHAL